MSDATISLLVLAMVVALFVWNRLPLRWPSGRASRPHNC